MASLRTPWFFMTMATFAALSAIRRGGDVTLAKGLLLARVEARVTMTELMGVDSEAVNAASISETFKGDPGCFISRLL